MAKDETVNRLAAVVIQFFENPQNQVITLSRTDALNLARAAMAKR